MSNFEFNMSLVDWITLSVITYHVINVKTQIDISFICVLDIYTFVTFVDFEVTRQYNIAKLLMPCLLETKVLKPGSDRLF